MHSVNTLLENAHQKSNHENICRNDGVNPRHDNEKLTEVEMSDEDQLYYKRNFLFFMNLEIYSRSARPDMKATFNAQNNGRFINVQNEL